MYDFHIHTCNSHDSKQTVDELCESAISKNLQGVAITDHVDMWFCESDNTYENISACIAETNSAREKYADKLNIFQGIEMAEYLYNPKNAEKIMKLADYDVILGSVHSVHYADFTDSYSRLDFSKGAVSSDKIKGFLYEYFNKLYEMTENTDFDILTHLTCPLRYINGKYARNIDLAEFKAEIDEILKLIIKRKISLEVNTSCLGSAFNFTMPDSDVIKQYRDLGGNMITLGSDAHSPDRIAYGFDFAVSELRRLDFEEYYTFKKRKPIPHKL